MSDSPAVSVVISTFNRSTLLSAALGGLVRQAVPPTLEYEIIVVDNNSSDNTSAVVRKFCAEDGRVRYVSEPRQGVSYGRNAGVRAARAPIVAFTDDDNVVASDWVATIKAAFDRHPEAAAIGGRVLPQWGGPVPPWLDSRHWAPIAILDYGARPFYTSVDDPRCLLTANLAVRRQLFSTIGEFSPDFPRCQDHELLIRFWRAGARILYTPDLVVYAHVGGERMTLRYHRAWHTSHGLFTATMQLEEIIDGAGHLIDAPMEVPRLWGSPGFVYRALLLHARRCAWAWLRRDRSASEAHAHRVRYFASYIRQTARSRTHSSGRLPEAAAFFRAHAAKRARAVNMPLKRIALVHAMLALLLGASAYDIVTGSEHWPVSPYPMFSHVEREATLDGLRIFGVTDEPVPREIPLLEPEMIAPFDQTRLSTALSRALADPAHRPLLDDMLRDCLLRYERLRALGRNTGPALRAVRLYDVHWTLDARAANVDAPDSRRLVADTGSGGAAASN